MNFLPLSLTTESMLLAGSGEGSTMVDADIVFHRSGFPMIPARRIKGMLKESLEEVLEISGLLKDEIQDYLTALFGYSGQKNNEGKLIFRNLFLENWEQILEGLKPQNEEDPLLPKAYIKSFFTTEVQQTAIDEKSGIAKEHSLRNYRVLKPGFTFIGKIELQETLTEDELDYFTKAVEHFRYAGTRRNRGFGKISCKLGEAQQLPESSVQTQTLDSVTAIKVHLQTLSPVVLAQQIGEQNTVFTAKDISGNRLRGILAEQYIRQNKSLSRANAHEDVDFQQLFLSGQLKFGNLNYSGAQPIPLHIQYNKILPEEGRVNFSIFDANEAITKPLAVMGKLEGSTIEELKPTTTFAFHNSREDRAAGRSTKGQIDGGIFYYESLDEAQEFEGEIRGDAKALAKLLNIFNKPIRGSLGRSRSAQYGEVELHLKAIQNDTPITQSFAEGDQLVLTLLSPLMLLNEQGCPAPNEQNLKNSLAEALGLNKHDYEIETAVPAITSVEQYNAMWQSKSGKYPAYKEGSSFLIKLNKAFELKEQHLQMGEWTEQGFGAFTLTRFEAGQKYTKAEEKKKPQIASTPTEQQPQLINAIVQYYENSITKEKIKTKAIQFTQGKSGLNNHQIGRMERLFESKNSEEAIQQWIAQATDTINKNRQFADALKKINLLNEENEFRFELGDRSTDFAHQRLFWITFFQALRKRNKELSNGN